ncbi:hypothetical protein ASE14_07585 [Agromyces sp. Root81]|nr:hypothetical protein ASE14_07585 [Agromyces sp. Root81]
MLRSFHCGEAGRLIDAPTHWDAQLPASAWSVSWIACIILRRDSPMSLMPSIAFSRPVVSSL